MGADPTGLIFDVKRHAVHDGPGIRTTVFLKGCSLGCKWCHNPESIERGPELFVRPARCIACGACVDACPEGAHGMTADGAHAFDRSKCAVHGGCVEVCYAEALEIAGRHHTVGEVVQMVIEDADFYDTSGGGVTLSGGEPLLQAEFAVALLSRLKTHGIHTAVDTSGHVPWSSFEAVLPHTDLVLFDLKHASPDVHRRHTGARNDLIVSNLTRLSDAGASIEIRVPVVPGINDSPGDAAAIGRLIAPLDAVRAVRLLPYLRFSGSKYAAVGRRNTLPDVEMPSENDLLAVAAAMSAAADRPDLVFVVSDRIVSDAVARIRS